MLKDVIGHKTNIDLLRNSLCSGRIANAYLFAGPPDVGKEFVAVNFAKLLGNDLTLNGSVDTINGDISFSVTPAQWDRVITQMLRFEIRVKTLETPTTT